MKKRLLNRIILISVSIWMVASMAGCSVDVSGESVSGLVISEVVTSNSNSLVDPLYGRPDWIELYNSSDSAINLQEYSISEDSSNRFVFPSIEIGAGEYLLVYCCAEPEGVDSEVMCTGFKLSKSGVTLGLSSPDSVVQTLKVPELKTDLAWGLDFSDGTYKYFIPTPGAANDSRSFTSLDELQNSDTVALVINEVLPESTSQEDPYGWVELYNAGSEPIELSALYITDNLSNLAKARLPNIALSPGEYTVLRLSGETGESELPFRIGADETALAVADSMGKIVDMLTWDAGIMQGISAGPDADGTVYYAKPTPGGPNGEGMKSAGFTEAAGALRINEMLLNNTFSAIDEDGERSAWVELHNTSDSAVNLGDYALSDNGNRLLKWRLPDRELEPGGYELVFLSGKNRAEGELHANFRLGVGETKLYLVQVNTGTYEAADVPQENGKNVSFGLSTDGKWLYFAQPTPLMPNDAHGFAELSAASGASSTGLLINEVAAVSAAKSRGADWVELYNNSDSDLNLKGYYLSDSRKDLTKWPIGSTTVKSGGYAVIKNYSMGDESGELGIRHSGETLYLSNPAGVVLDQIETGVLRPGFSRGVVRDESARTTAVLANPTPGAANDEGSRVNGYCAVPFFSVSGGYKTEPVSLEMRTTTPDATIHYTVDGSTPTAHSPRYSGPITISSSMTVRAIAVAPGRLSSEEMVATYLFVADKHLLPVVCLSISESDFNYVCGSRTRADDRERAGYVEYYEADGALGVRFPAGFRIAGAGTRTHAQKSFNLYLRGGYGLSSVTYPFFEDYEIKTFKSLSLRNMGQDYVDTCLRDAYFHTIANGMNILNMRSKFAVVYVNGKYWGLYEFKENQNEDYLNAKFGIDPDKVEFIRSTKYAYKGSSKMINELFSIADRSRSSESSWEKYKSLIDVDYFTDYLVMQTFMGNRDYYNQKYTHTTDNSLPWRPMYYDFDLALRSSTSNAWAFFQPGGVTNTDEMGNVTSYIDMGLYYALYCNSEWRDQFVQRYAELMNTSLSTENLLLVLDNMAASIEDEMPRHIARWKTPGSVSSWEKNVADFRKALENRRPHIIKELTKIFGLSDEEVKELWPNG